jgi:multiple sugar transport system permease protein
MDNQANAPKVLKESKRKITVDFERTSLKERLKLKYLNMSYVGGLVWRLFRFLLLVGVSYVILYPFFSKITSSFMSAKDFVDVTVKLVPKYPTLNTYRAVMFDLANDTAYFKCLLNSTWLSLGVAFLQTFTCCVIGYGFAKFKFKGSGILFALVLFTMIVPHGTIQIALQSHFQRFDFLGICKLLSGKLFPGFAPLTTLAENNPDTLGIGLLRYGDSLNLINTPVPFILMSIGGVGFKNGLYIYMMRQFFKGVPDELEESAYLDGYGIFKTFLFIVIPLSVPMMITIFLFSFSWQWTDEFYTGMFFEGAENLKFLPDIISASIDSTQYINVNEAGAAKTIFDAAIYNTKGLLIIIPLLIIYLFCQRYLVEGIERSGLVG